MDYWKYKGTWTWNYNCWYFFKIERFKLISPYNLLVQISNYFKNLHLPHLFPDTS